MPQKTDTYIKKYCKSHEKICIWTPKATTCIERRKEIRESIVINRPASKDCIICGQHKPASEFDIDNSVRCGLKGACKVCVKERDYKRYNSWDGYVQKKVVASWKAHNNNDMVNKIDDAMKLLIDQDYKCNHCNKQLECTFGTQMKKNCWGASLDRIDVDIVGYGNGNGQWLCMSCNNGKCTMPNSEHKEKFASKDRRIAELEIEVNQLKKQINELKQKE